MACYHCGEECQDETIVIEDKKFCCEGCKMVYEIINTNDLDQYYRLQTQPGTKRKKKQQYEWLEDENIVRQLINFTNDDFTKITFFLPQIHCASCIWLLENLYKLNEEVLSVNVNFLKKEAYITYNHHKLSLRSLVELLSMIGYAPNINLNDLDNTAQKPAVDKRLYYQLGIAGFAFGNIMLLSFPEYLGLQDAVFKQWFGYLNICLSLPVVFFSGFHYLKSAWFGIRQSDFNIDVPISLGILTLFGRSIFEIVILSEAGYLDSLAGLIFFLLIGRWFQQKTYHQLSFERDYKSYFPIAATLLKNGKTTSTTLQQLKVGDQILVKHQELIPADGILTEGIAKIDYSFVTGEAHPIGKSVGESVFAGGRQIGQALKITITKKVNQSYLTQLWNESAFQKSDDTHASQIANKVGKYFTYAILLIAFSTLSYWLVVDQSIAFQAFTAVLIIACPCAVALSVPFTFGNVLRLLAREGFYLKNTLVIEKLKNMTAVVFDKTGTITNNDKMSVQYFGAKLSEKEAHLIYKTTNNSSHPLSVAIAKKWKNKGKNYPSKFNNLQYFKEITGKGIEGILNKDLIKIGSKNFIKPPLDAPNSGNVYVSINGQFKGYFEIKPSYRTNLKQVLNYFKTFASLHLLSGDNDKERKNLSSFFPFTNLHFQKNPTEKLAFIQELQQKNDQVMMFGDGLNDAGALKQANVGIVITEDTNNFTPASDAILRADQFAKLPVYLQFIKGSVKLVYVAYFLAFIYNIIGLSFAVQGLLSPVIAAILMPLSSVTIVVFGVVSSTLLGRFLIKSH